MPRLIHSPKPGSLLALGRVEGREQVLAYASGNAASVVQYRDANSLAAQDRTPGLTRACAASVRRPERSLQLHCPPGWRIPGATRREIRARCGRLEAFVDPNMVLLDLRREQHQHAVQHLVQIHRYRASRLAVEGQQLAGDLGNTSRVPRLPFPDTASQPDSTSAHAAAGKPGWLRYPADCESRGRWSRTTGPPGSVVRWCAVSARSAAAAWYRETPPRRRQFARCYSEWARRSVR